MFLLPDQIELTKWNDPLFSEQGVEVLIARLDKIHPLLSGNKLFKLYYFLEQASENHHAGILTFGGAYSNHLVATAYACKRMMIPCVGIVRGEKPAELSHTLQQCQGEGMHLHFVSRAEYALKETTTFTSQLLTKFENYLIVPEGGYHADGAKGASLIMDLIGHYNATHICAPVGTATTIAGLLTKVQTGERIIGVSVLKNLPDIYERIAHLTSLAESKQLIIFDEYHFGGYVRCNKKLISFMNELYHTHQIPSDFVYTAKMLYAVADKIKTGFFQKGDRIICIHTGGLQGNHSLPAGTLNFNS